MPIIANELRQTEGDLPYLIQGSIAPCFKGIEHTDSQLFCSYECGQILIDNYEVENYVNVGIKCFRCRNVTRTPGLISGEIFATTIHSLGESGKFLLNSIVPVPPNIMLTCDKEIKNTLESTSPKNVPCQLDISFQGLNLLVREYDEVVGDNFEVQRKIIDKFGGARAKDFPFAWAICYIRRCLKDDYIDLSHSTTRTALTWLQTFRHVVDIWKHHPRFNSVAKDLGKPASFLHTSSQLIAAAYLYRAGNQIGLSLENRPGQPNPDLYLRRSGKTNVFLEVKAPQALQWSDEAQSVVYRRIESAVKRCVQYSASQINRKHPGILMDPFTSPCVRASDWVG